MLVTGALLLITQSYDRRAAFDNRADPTWPNGYCAGGGAGQGCHAVRDGIDLRAGALTFG
jgi:hypothetical protein